MNILKVKNKVALAPVFLSLLLLAGCVNAGKMDKWIADDYGETVSLGRSKKDFITVSSPLITTNDKASTSVKRTKTLIPAIIFWKQDYEVSSTLNPVIPVNEFTAAFTSYASSKKIQQKLDGGKLELSIEKLPNTFSFNDDFTYFLIISVEKIYLLPAKNEMVINYRLVNGTAALKSGVITVPDLNKTEGKKTWKSIKKATTEYLEQYDENIKAMAKIAADKIMAEL